MNEKCTKYEGLFLFSDEETLKKHLEECEDCRAEHEKMNRVSDLIREVKPYYQKKSRLRTLRIAAAFLFLMFFSATFGVLYMNDELADSLLYQQESLSAEELGFPVDSYGLLMVGE